jgi:hypothetical protein
LTFPLGKSLCKRQRGIWKGETNDEYMVRVGLVEKRRAALHDILLGKDLMGDLFDMEKKKK